MSSAWKVNVVSLLVAVFALATLVTMLFPANASALYGRPQWTGYFSGTTSKGEPWGCGGGQMICGGIGSNDIDNFVSFYWGHLNGDTQSSRSAAFTVLVMLGVDGGDTGGADNGVQMAKNRFSEWETLVRAYGSAGKINFNHANFAFNTNTAYRLGDVNDILWRYDTDSATVISFDIGDGHYVAIKKSCANMVGDYSKLVGKPVDKPKPPGGPVGGVANGVGCQPMLIVLSPGRDYYGNAVPETASTSLGSWTRSSYSTIDVSSTHTTGEPFSITFSTGSYVSDLSPVYGSLGEITDWVPVYTPAQSWGGSIGPCFNYILTPSTNLSVSGVIEPDAPITINPSVNNTPSAIDRGHTKSRSTQWRISELVVAPKPVAIPHDGSSTTSGGEPCSYFSGPGVVCKPLASGSGAVYGTGVNNPVIANYVTSAGDYPVGTRICFIYSVQPYASSVPSAGSDSNWAHSAPSLLGNCLIVGKKPKLQVHGGDLSVGKVFSGIPLTPASVQTSISIKANGPAKNTFGSWIEYGIFATGTIKGAASGSAYAGATGLADGSLCSPHKLSFTNATNASDSTCGTLGKYTSAKLIPNVLASFAASGTPLPNAVVPNSLLPAAGGTFIGTRSGDIDLNPSTLAPGKSVILKVSGTVTITGNQTYNPDNNGAKYTRIAELPQLVIIANKIVINDNVTNVDAWLIASGVNGIIETCNINSSSFVLVDPAQKLTSKKCDKLLTINGPAMAKQLWLRRTAGSGVDTASGDPAEVFNLRPDTYLWATNRASGDGRVQTVYTTELPPRL